MSSSPSHRRTQKHPVLKSAHISASSKRSPPSKTPASDPTQLASAGASSTDFFSGAQSEFTSNISQNILPNIAPTPGSSLNATSPLQTSPTIGTKRKMEPYIQPNLQSAAELTANDPGGAAGPSTTVLEDSPPRPVKKSRTNTPWTPAEEKRLKAMRDQGSTWSEIAKEFPNRTEGSVKKHWYKDMHYAEFAEDESTALLEAIRDYEANKWKTIGQKVGKPAKACEQYAKEHFQGKI